MASRARPLKRLSRKPIRTKDVVQFIETVRELPDHALALVCAAFVERTLERVILSRLVRLTTTQHNELFVGLGPLSSLSAKIKLAYALGAIGSESVGDLNRIKDVRNQFAHSFHPISFRTRAVVAEVRKLKAPERAHELGINPTAFTWPPKDARTRYSVSCFVFWIALGGRRLKGPRPKRSNDPFARAILR